MVATCLPRDTIALTRILFFSARRVLRLFYYLIGSLQPTALFHTAPMVIDRRGQNLASRECNGQTMLLRIPETRDKSTLTFLSLLGTFALSPFADRSTKPSEFKLLRSKMPISLPRDLATYETKMLGPSTPETRCTEISHHVNLTMNHSMRENAETSLLVIS
jgi:hypothetical protein